MGLYKAYTFNKNTSYLPSCPTADSILPTLKHMGEMWERANIHISYSLFFPIIYILIFFLLGKLRILLSFTVITLRFFPVTSISCFYQYSAFILLELHKYYLWYAHVKYKWLLIIILLEFIIALFTW